MSTVDYVIVGAGSAGCTLAGRLTEDPDVNVLLLEAGGKDRSPDIKIPAAFGNQFHNAKLDWDFATEPEPGCHNRSLYVPRGKTLGGSSSMNAMLYVRGRPIDYDLWVQAGAEGWGWDDVLPYFLRSEHNERGASEFHATGGPLNVAEQRSPRPIAREIIAACEAAGIPYVPDYNTPEQDGVSMFQVTQKNGRRWSAADAYLRPAMKRANLQVVTGARVLGLELSGDRVTGVRYATGRGGETVARPGADVILCAGAIGSPQILMVSGIGHADELAAAGVKALHDLPDVGKGLQDHPFLTVNSEVSDTDTLYQADAPQNLAEWVLRRSGKLTSTVAEVCAFVRTRAGLPAADIQFHMGAAYFQNHGQDLFEGNAATIGATLVAPKSRGEVTLRSADPSAKPKILTNALTEPEDVASMVAGIRLAREVFASEPLRSKFVRELTPGAEHQSDEEIEAVLRDTVELIYHPTCTCAIGSVVDPELRVKGLDGLRVVDASVFPVIPGGNTNAPTIMVAERAADLIRGRVGGAGLSTLLDVFAQRVADDGDRVAIRTLDDGVRWTWAELDERARRAAAGLRELGVNPGDTVGLLLNNREEFYVFDVAALMLGATPVSVYSTSSPEQVAYVAQDAGFAVLVTERALRDGAASYEGPVVVVEETTLQEHEPLAQTHDGDESELVTIIYTSGTTGPPKGVELTHRNVLHGLRGIGAVSELRDGGRTICWLPMAHVAERCCSLYGALLWGNEVTVCPDPRRIGDYLKAVHPTWFFAVPRIWEKLKAGTEAAVAAMPDDQRGLVQRAIERATERVWLIQEGKDVPAELEAAVAEADPVLGRLRSAIGLDEIQCSSVGAAPCAPEVIAFFHALGVPLAEIYGQSEGVACATNNPPSRIKIGSVGPPVPGVVELKLAEDGEILIRGEMLMRGYRNKPQETAESYTADGFFQTGDIGEIDDDGYVKIVDRKKELIINAAGKNMSPANIEAAIKTGSPLIGQVVAVGDRRSYNVALIVLDPDALGGRSAQDVHDEIAAAVEKGNARLARVEQVKRFRVLEAPWAPGGDELTPTMKLKRKPIAEKYAEEIEALYAKETA